MKEDTSINFSAIWEKSKLFQYAIVSNSETDLAERLQEIEEKGSEFQNECKKQIRNARQKLCDETDGDSDHEGKLQRATQIYMDLVTNGFDEMIDKVRAKAGNVSEDISTAVLAETLSSGIDLLSKEQISLMVLDDDKDKDTSDSMSPHMRRKMELGLI